jgi:AraC-like DNA-binding protein
MLIRESITEYKHIDLGNIKLAFTRVCQPETFKDVYFAANALYYVESGSASIYLHEEEIRIKKGEVCLIKQHSKLDIRKFKDEDGKDFKSIIFYLFPDFVTEFIKQGKKSLPGLICPDMIHLGADTQLTSFCESLLPLFEAKKPDRSGIREQTFAALNHLSRHNTQLLHFLSVSSKPVKIDLYEFMIHIAEHNYSVNELAQLTGRSLSAFKRDFYEVFETTPHQWLLRKKIELAYHLLHVEKMKASNIYFMLGFNELSHFSAAFKKMTGVAPSQL